MKARRVRPILERLEDRIAPATIAGPSGVWTSIGPAPIVGNTSDGGIVSGRVTSIAPNPADPTGNSVYIGTAGGGVWAGSNIHSNAPTWTPLTDNLAAQVNDPFVTLSVGAVTAVLDPASQITTIYAGLGEANAESTFMTPGSGGSQFYGTGIIKSSDGGQNWSLLGGNGTSNIFYRSAISKIIALPPNPAIVGPNNLGVVYAAVSTAKNGVVGQEGIYISTDAGVTWTNLTAATGLPTNLMYSDLVIDPANRSILYAAIGEAAGDPANGVYMTTDGGIHWQQLAGLPTGGQGGNTGAVGRITLALSPTPDPATGNYVLYAALMAIAMRAA